MPEVIRIYPDGRIVRLNVSTWDIEQHIRVSSRARPSCAHVVDGQIRTTGTVNADAIKAAMCKELFLGK